MIAPEVIVGGSPLYELQRAVFSILSAGLAPVPVYDGEVPDSLNDGAGVKFPYVMLGDAVYQQADRHTTTANNVVFTVNAYSNYKGASEVKRIENQIATLLNRRESILQMTGWVGNLLTVDFSQVFTEVDGIHRAITRFRAIVQPVR